MVAHGAHATRLTGKACTLTTVAAIIICNSVAGNAYVLVLPDLPDGKGTVVRE